LANGVTVSEVDSIKGVHGPALAARAFCPTPFIVRLQYEYVIGNVGGQGGVAWDVWIPFKVIEVSRRVIWQT
jgi:hypothetical protein